MPVSRLVNRPVYVPPCSQIVSPGFTAAATLVHYTGYERPAESIRIQDALLRRHAFTALPV